MRLVVCYPYITGYMAACWRALHACEDVELSIIALKSDVPGVDWRFEDEQVTSGLNIRFLSPQEHQDQSLVRSLVADARPQVVVIPGWAHASYRNLVDAPQLSGVKFVMTMDTPWRGTLRQRLGRYKLAPLLRRLALIVVPGERAWQLARAFGMLEEKIRRGLYGIDYAAFEPVLEERRALAGGWPRNFIYAGRYHEEKGVDLLLEAYRTYRPSVSDPWGLTCCGSGRLEAAVNAEPGVTNLGFLQPSQQPQLLATHAVAVLASRFDPWPLAIVEACAAGLPVVHTEACGSAVELVRPYYNGIPVPTGNVVALASAMRWCHEHHDQLPQMGARGQPLAAGYSADVWVVRWRRFLRELCDGC